MFQVSASAKGTLHMALAKVIKNRLQNELALCRL